MSQEIHNPFVSTPAPEGGTSKAATGRLLGRVGVALFKTLDKDRGVTRAQANEGLLLGLSAAERLRMQEEAVNLKPGEFLMELSDASEPPSREDFCNPKPIGYGLKECTLSEYFEAPFSQFAFKDWAFSQLKVDAKIQTILKNIEQNGIGRIVATIVDADELLALRKSEDPSIESIDAEEIVRIMDERGYRPATYKELLACMLDDARLSHCITAPEGYSLTALGSIQSGDGGLLLCAPMLGFDDKEKSLHEIYWLDAGGSGKFLFVRKAPTVA